MALVWGRDCKLGWGWNESLGLLIPIEGESCNVKSETQNRWGYNVSSLSSTDFPDWVRFLFLNERYPRCFRIS